MKARGFTLIEVVVAVAIFAIISSMSYAVLATVLDSRARIEQETKKWRDIGLALARIEQDLNSLVNRPARDAGGLLQPALLGIAVPRGDEGQLILTRMGDLDLPGTAGAPQRIGYRCTEGMLQQLLWPVLDQGPRTRPSIAPVLEGVTACEFRYLDQRGQWQTLWPARDATPGTASVAPAAVEVTITLQRGEQVRRLLPIVWGGQ